MWSVREVSVVYPWTIDSVKHRKKKIEKTHLNPFKKTENKKPKSLLSSIFTKLALCFASSCNPYRGRWLQIAPLCVAFQSLYPFSLLLYPSLLSTHRSNRPPWSQASGFPPSVVSFCTRRSIASNMALLAYLSYSIPYSLACQN